jgi:hypothetical protein
VAWAAGRDSESCLVIAYIYKDAWSLAQAKGLPSLIYHEPVLEVRFVRGAAGTMRILSRHRIVSSTDSFVRLYPFLSILLLAEDLYRALQR